jgi:ParB-like chromosome segregation protein Spo0J
MTKIHNKLTMIPTDSLIPYARNSRTHSEAQVSQIAASIKEFGFTNPVLIDESGGIIAGHGRVMAARKLGMAEVPCITLAGLTESQRRAYVIADNRLAELAGWDSQMLALEMSELKLGGYDLSLTAWTAAEADEIGFTADASTVSDAIRSLTTAATDKEPPLPKMCPHCGEQL